MTQKNTAATERTIELSGQQLERWERLREQWTDDEMPELTDEQMVKSLLDTVKAAREGYYAE